MLVFVWILVLVVGLVPLVHLLTRASCERPPEGWRGTGAQRGQR